MCLEVLAQITDNAPGRIGAKRLGELSGLVISSSRLDGLPALHFSVSGGCSCEFLARGHHKQRGTWRLFGEYNMSYILSDQRDRDVVVAFEAYREY